MSTAFCALSFSAITHTELDIWLVSLLRARDIGVNCFFYGQAASITIPHLQFRVTYVQQTVGTIYLSLSNTERKSPYSRDLVVIYLCFYSVGYLFLLLFPHLLSASFHRGKQGGSDSTSANDLLEIERQW